MPTADRTVILEVPWRRIRPMPGQPREHFDRDGLISLADSISAVGQVVPAPAAAVQGDPRHDYELIDGERRWRAVQIAGLETLRIQVVDEPDESRRYLLSVAANMARQANHPLEIAVACDRLRRTMTVERVAASLGKSVPYVYQHLKLLSLHPEIREAMHPSTPKNRRLPMAAALRLAGLEPAGQFAALAKIRASGLSPGRAAIWAVEDEGRNGKARPPDGRDRRCDRVRSLAGHLRRTDDAMARMDPAAFVESLDKMSATRRSELVGLLRSTADRAALLIGAASKERA